MTTPGEWPDLVAPASPPRVPAADVVTVDGAPLAVLDTGGTAPPVVLLHGLGASLASWWSLVPRLAERHRVVAYDRSGFGDSPLPDGVDQREAVLSEQGAAAQLWALCDHLGLGDVALVGHSAGGAVAATAALGDPGRVRALGLVGAPLSDDLLVPDALLQVAAEPRFREAVRRLHPRVTGPLLALGLLRVYDEPRSVDPAILAAHRRSVLGVPWAETVWEVAVHHGPPTTFARLGELEVPTLVLTGEHDQVVAPAVAEALAAAIPGASLVVVRATGHSPHEERPGEVLAALGPLLAGAAPR